MDTPAQIKNLAAYYALCANEYEEIYYRDDVQRQKEQKDIQFAVKEVLSGAEVLEVACGTGYWTQFVSETAGKITATDFNHEVLEIARHKHYSCPVSIQKADAYNLSFEPKSFTGGLANFWFSHIPKEHIGLFLHGFHKLLNTGSHVFIADNMNVAGIGGDLVRKPGDENTYKLRTLKDGTQQEILKNYFTKDELLQLFKQYDPTLCESDICIGKCFWYVKYKVAHYV